MKNSHTASPAGVSGFLSEFALAPYRAAFKFASMANHGTTSMLRLNRAFMDAYRESIRGQQDMLDKLSTSVFDRLSHDGLPPAAAFGAISQSWTDMYRAAAEGAAQFGQAMTSAREQCTGRTKMEAVNADASEAAEKKAA